jgi:hypothetical protein
VRSGQPGDAAAALRVGAAGDPHWERLALAVQPVDRRRPPRRVWLAIGAAAAATAAAGLLL